MNCRSDHNRPPRGRFFFTVVALLWALTASGHGGSDNDKGKVNAVLDALPPELSALRVQLKKTLAPQLLVGNPTDQVLTVEDEAGRAFLRIGPEHAEGDLGAAAFHRTNTLMAPGTIPADASSEPRWKIVEPTPNWGWLDLRLRTGAVEVPHAIVDAGKRAPVGEWSIPVRLGDTESAISGHFEYVPTPRGIVEAKVTDTGALKGQALVRALTGSSRPGMFVSYRGERPLTLLGAQGEPFLRFSDQGVEVNRHSRTWAKVAPSGAPTFVANSDDAETRWAPVSASRSYGWIEPRAAFNGTVDNADEPAIVKQWRIPVRVGDTDSAIKGVTEWIPVEPVAKAR